MPTDSILRISMTILPGKCSQVYNWFVERVKNLLYRLCLAICVLLAAAAPAAAQSDRVVALVISVGEGAARADAIQARLQVLGAETLRAADPNNAELRSILKRFGTEAVNTRASLVYLDMPAVLFQGREFVLPARADVNRPTDLFTEAIPLSAFARAAAQSEQGGGVIITVGLTPQGLPSELRQVQTAPAPLAGAGPILVAEYGASDPIMQVMATTGGEESVDLAAMLRVMSTGEKVTLSQVPATPIYLKSPPRPEGAEAPIEAAIAPSDGQETVEELAVLEQSLSRSAKRALQRALRDRGHYKGLVDGIFGPQTREAITEFQAARGEAQTSYLSRRQLLDLR